MWFKLQFALLIFVSDQVLAIGTGAEYLFKLKSSTFKKYHHNSIIVTQPLSRTALKELLSTFAANQFNNDNRQLKMNNVSKKLKQRRQRALNSDNQRVKKTRPSSNSRFKHYLQNF